ncbi:protein enabled [Frankliniella occidentalis]|uniref:Protein enabled n=1 Tax=Frankliniella occidentalis TaxID=133901 RepID=A0A6J1RTW8_FRAOC|nr:protein enabled [Frankliniella occidentalis]
MQPQHVGSSLCVLAVHGPRHAGCAPACPTLRTTSNNRPPLPGGSSEEGNQQRGVCAPVGNGGEGLCCLFSAGLLGHPGRFGRGRLRLYLFPDAGLPKIALGQLTYQRPLSPLAQLDEGQEPRHSSRSSPTGSTCTPRAPTSRTRTSRSSCTSTCWKYMKTCVILLAMAAACAAFPHPGPPAPPGPMPPTPHAMPPPAPPGLGTEMGKQGATSDLKGEEALYLASPYSALPYQPYSAYNIRAPGYGLSYGAIGGLGGLGYSSYGLQTAPIYPYYY